MQVTVALPVDAEVRIPAGNDFVYANLVVPARPSGLVVFAHGSGSSRHSPRNMLVAKELQTRQLGTLLLDLLTRAEEQREVQTREHRFDIPLLGERLVAATRWLRSERAFRDLAVGYFGASTGSDPCPFLHGNFRRAPLAGASMPPGWSDCDGVA